MRAGGSAAGSKRGKDKGLKRQDDDGDEYDRNSDKGSRASKKSRQSQPALGRSFVKRCYMCGCTADERTFMSQDSTGMPVDDGCYNCGGTWSDTNPGQPWSAGKEKFDREPKWRPKFHKAARIRSGEIDPPIFETSSNVLDWESVEMEITQELGLLSESEFESLAGFSGAALKAEMEKVPSHLGIDKSFFIITLDGLPCTTTNGMRKLKCKYRFGLTREDMLLSAARQLVEGQGKAVFSYHSAQQLQQRPKGLQAEEQFKNLSSLEKLKEKVQKAMAKSGAGPVKPKGASSSDGEGDEGGPKEKKLRVQQSGRLQRLVQPKRKSKSQKAEVPEVATVENGAEQVPKALESVVSVRGATPKCFLNLHIERILAGEKLMRSVDAAKRIMDEMKAQRQFQWKTLHKHIEMCELANALTHTPAQLSARECRLSMEKLLSNNIDLPFNIRVVGTEKILAGTWHDLFHSPLNTSAQDIKKIVDQMMSVLISWRHCMGDEVEPKKKAKEVDIFSYNDLAAELKTEKEDEEEDENSKVLETLEEELESSILHAMGCGEFFAMIEEPKLHERLKGVTVRFVTKYNEDDVPSLDMSKTVSNAMDIVFKAMACLLVLLEPTPGYLGTTTSHVAKIMSYKGNGGEDDFLGALQLHLQDNGIWQSRVDEVLKLGGSAVAFGEQLKEHVVKMKSISEEDGYSEHFVQAVDAFDTLKNGLRKNAVDELQSLIRETTQKYIEKLCASTTVAECDGGMIQVLMQAVDKFPQKDMLQVKQKFLKWQQRIQVELHKQEASALGNKILNEAGNDEAEVPIDELAKLLDKFKAEKELKNDAKQLLQQLVWAAMTKVHNQASNHKRLAYQIFSILDGFGKIAFDDFVAESLKLQMQYMQDGLHLLKQLDKFRKLGSDSAGRLKNDVRWGSLLAYLKQLEGLRVVRDKAIRSMDSLASSAPAEHAKLKELCFSGLERPFQVPEDMQEAFVLAMKEMQKSAEDLIDKVGDITNNLHMPKSRWTKDLQPDAAAETVKMCVASTLDFDVSELEPTLQSLKEVNAKIVLWKKKVTVLKEMVELGAESAAFLNMCEKVKQSLFDGYVFRSEGIFANAIMEANKGEAQKLVRAELSYLQGDHWQLGIDDTHVHPAVLAAAKRLLDKK